MGGWHLRLAQPRTAPPAAPQLFTQYMNCVDKQQKKAIPGLSAGDDCDIVAAARAA